MKPRFFVSLRFVSVRMAAMQRTPSTHSHSSIGYAQSVRRLPPAACSRPAHSRVPSLAALLAVLAVVCAGIAGSATDAAAADDRGKRAIAPPGPCAEPREAAYGAAPSGPETSAFSVVGPLDSFFDPRDVAAAPGPPITRQGPPTAAALIRPGACDQPGAGCGAAPQGFLVNPPFEPGKRP